MIPKKDKTRIAGIITLNDLLTAGGILSPRLISNFLILDTLMKISVASNPIIIPANIPVVPRLPNVNTPVISTAVSAPTGTIDTVLGIIITNVANAIAAAAKGSLKLRFLDKL